MRRGLISYSKAELPDAVLEARVELLHATMRAARHDAFVLYSNNTRPAAISWLTGFVPYWSEALLVLLHDRPPILVVALTYRVKHWIEATSRVSEVIHAPRIGVEAARVIAGAKANARIAIPELDHIPRGIIEDLRSVKPSLILTDGSLLFTALRAKTDPAEVAFAARAGSIALSALAAPAPSDIADGNINAMIATIDGEARRLGAEEIYIAAAPDLSCDARLRRIEGDARTGKSFALRATVAYKGTWIRLVRTFAEPGLTAEATGCLSMAVAQLPRERGFAPFVSWLVEGCRIAQPLEPLAGSRLEERSELHSGALVSVQGLLQVGGQSMLVGAPALLG